MGGTERQIGAQPAIGEAVFSRRITTPSPRVNIVCPPRRGTVGWQLTVIAWPTATAGIPAVAFVLVNSSDPDALTNILQDGAAAMPDGGVPLSPGQALTDFIRKDRDNIWVDVRGTSEGLAADSAVNVTIELHALYASPECPEPVGVDCSVAPERRKC